MGDTNDHDQNHEPRKIINFNAPLLTTRRPANLASISLSSCHSAVCRRNGTGNDDHHRIPFSWETAPGKPKDTDNKGGGRGGDDESETPRPKLPPSLWRYRHMIATKPTTKNDDDIGCDADFEDVDDNDNNNNDDIDDVNKDDDVFSLSEAIDIVERSQKSHEADGLRLKIIEDRSRSDNQYPDFIIQRFLPDATALATASALSAMNLKKNSTTAYDSNYREALNSSASATKAMSFSSPKGCGFRMLFPWSVKHRLCGVKNPIQRGGSDVFSGCTGIQLQRRHNEKRR